MGFRRLVQLTLIFILLSLFTLNFINMPNIKEANAALLATSTVIGPTELPVITSTNAQKLIEFARLCATNADGCGFALSWSADNKQLAIRSTTGLDIFDVWQPNRASKHILVPDLQSEEISPDFSLLAVLTKDGSASIWDVQQGQIKFTIPLSNRRVETISFSPNGEILVLFTSDGNLRLWDVKTEKELLVQMADQGNYPMWAISPDGKIFAISTSPTIQSRSIQLWNINTRQIITDLAVKGSEPIISHIRFSPDSSMLIASSNFGTTVWNGKTYTKLFDLNMTFKYDWALGSVFSPDSNLLAVFGKQKIYVWDVKTQKEISVMDGLGIQGVGVCFGTDKSWLISTDWSDSDSKPYVRLWETMSGKILSYFVNEQSPILSPDGTLLATNEYGGSVIIRALQ